MRQRDTAWRTILAAITSLALVNGCNFGSDDLAGGEDGVTATSEALISGCSVSVNNPDRVWVGTGDNGHYALRGIGYIRCSGPHNLSATMTGYRNGDYFDSRSQSATNAWGMNFTALMVCPKAANLIELRLFVHDLKSNATTTVYSPPALWVPGC